MIYLTEHAILRYQERVKPHLSFREAKLEAERFIQDFAVITAEPPKWFYALGEHDEDLTGWAALTDNIGFPLIGSRAVTCVVCGGLGETAREARNHQRRGRQRARHARRQKFRSTAMTNRDRAGQPRKKDWDAAA